MAPPTTTYVTRSGDTWDQIAKRVLGDEMLMNTLIDANPAHNYVARFDAGIVLNVPTPAPTPAPLLPPWRLP